MRVGGGDGDADGAGAGGKARGRFVCGRCGSFSSNVKCNVERHERQVRGCLARAMARAQPSPPDGAAEAAARGLSRFDTLDCTERLRLVRDLLGMRAALPDEAPSTAAPRAAFADAMRLCADEASAYTSTGRGPTELVPLAFGHALRASGSVLPVCCVHGVYDVFEASGEWRRIGLPDLARMAIERIGASMHAHVSTYARPKWADYPIEWHGGGHRVHVELTAAIGALLDELTPKRARRTCTCALPRRLAPPAHGHDDDPPRTRQAVDRLVARIIEAERARC